MALSLSSLSKEYVRVGVAAKEAGVAVNPTADVVQMAFVAPGAEPAGGDWQTASWETDQSTEPDSYFARCLVGPGAVVLAEGTWAVWLKVTDSPEVPVREVGRLIIT